MKQKLLLIIGSSFISLTLFGAHVAAIPAITPGLTVSPAIKQLSLTDPNKSISFNALITNNTKDRMVVDMSTTDFTAYSEAGGIVFLPDLTNRPHGLAQWLKPDISEVALTPGQSSTIPVTITPDRGLAPGGHYGALVYKVLATGSAQKGNLIGNNEAVSTLVFLTTSSGSTQNVELDGVSLSKYSLALPKSVNLVLKDTGNTQTTPIGYVRVLSTDNKEVAKGIINQDSGLILPGTSRLYNISLKKEVKNFLPGSYKLVVVYQASGNNTPQIYVANFVVISTKTIIAISLLIVLVAVLIVQQIRHKSHAKISPKKSPKKQNKK